MGQSRHRFVIVAVLAALLAPAVFDHDDFPFATYPMYATSRGDVVSVATANGVTTAGDESRLTLAVIGESDDPLIVAALVRDAVRGGLKETEMLCRQIAARVAGDNGVGRNDRDVGDPETAFHQIMIVSESHNVIEHTSDRDSLVSRQIHTRCPVPS